MGLKISRSEETSHFFKKIRQWTKNKERKKERLCQLTSVMLCSLFSISWPFKMGLITGPEMLVTVTTLHCVISQKSRDHSWSFGNTCLGLALQGPVQNNPVWHFLRKF